MDGLLGQAHKKRQKNQRHEAEDQHRKQDEEVAKQTWLVLNDRQAYRVTVGALDLGRPAKVSGMQTLTFLRIG